MDIQWEQGNWHWCLLNGSCWIGWTDHWQTLISGIFAVGAAYAAVRAAREQIRVGREQISSADAQAKAARIAKLRAARASLPTTLSAVCDYAEQAMRQLNAAWPTARTLYPDDTDAEITVRTRMPAFPAEVLASLERVVELTENDAVADRIESILREVQVLTARTRSLHQGEIVLESNLASYILEAASIYARASSLFSFARKRSETVDEDPLWNAVAVALSVSGVDRDAVNRMAEREKAQGLPPGEAETLHV